MIKILGGISIIAAIVIIAVKIGYECGRYHRSPEAMLQAALLRLDLPVWEPGEPSHNESYLNEKIRNLQ